MKKPVNIRRYFTERQGSQGRIEMHGSAAFYIEAVNNGWSVFHPITPDIGIDYVIAKEYGAVMVQLKTATLMSDNRYHVEVGEFHEGPLGYIVYHFQDVNAFFLIPTVEYWEIDRFKRFKDRVFSTGKPYRDTMSIETARKVMGDYEGKKGWDRLEQLTDPEALSEAIKGFIDNHSHH